MSDLISRKSVIEYLMINMNWMDEEGEQVEDSNKKRGIITDLISGVPSVEPWDIVKTMLKELEQKEERLYSDYCETTASLKAISKIAKSNQTMTQKIDGIVPLAEPYEGM